VTDTTTAETSIELTPENRAKAAGLLLRHLRTERSRGTTHAFLSPEATTALRALPETFQAEGGSTVVREEPKSSPEGFSSVPPLSARKEKALQLRAIRQEIEANQALTGMDSLRDTLVFAVGNANADLMFVGEAPGAEEEKKGEPFVGPAGQLLTKIIGAMGFQRSDVYISNIVKFRPKLPNQTTQNRQPTPEEMAPFKPYVAREVEVVQPKVIVALGRTAAEGLLDVTDSIGKARGRRFDFNGIPAFITYHPSYLLRNGAVSEKRKVWEDLLIVMEEIGMPITEKQRRFFQ
jgi:uracil-DNA glycosylase family 4